ncbi:MAG TPA: hypoxanthine phosphoribosyltransferase [Candidatus Limihabitans stercoravium]|nr:hypoxanthine phosphoribosyltransferase [Candidatus Limihabitans stercoravium]
MEHTNLIKATLVSEQQIKQRIAELGKQITADYKGRRPIVIGVLKGAWIYLADLLREVDLDVDVDFMSVSSYGSGTSTSGTITIVKDLSVDVTGRDVLIVEDIVDSGLTLARLKDLMRDRNAKSVEISTLLSKPSRRKVEVDVKYIGFEIPDEFVIGYGLDFDEKYRTLRDICVLAEEAYK